MIRKKKVRRKKTKRTLFLALTIGVVIVILAAVLYRGVYQGQPTEPEHKEAKDYFEILNPTVDNGELRENDTVVIIYQMSFTLKAVGGNATYATVNHKGYYMAEPVDVGNMTQGEARWVQITIPQPGYLSERTEKMGKLVFPIKIPIFCEEAWGDVTVYIPYS